MALDNVQQYPEVVAPYFVRDVEQLVSVILTKFPIMNYIPLGGGAPILRNTHEWFDDQITQQTDTLAANVTAHAASATGLSITVTDDTIFIIGDQLLIGTFKPVYQVTAKPGSNVLTCNEIRGVALASDAGNGDVVKYNRAVKELTNYSDSDREGFKGARLGTQAENFTQMFRKDIQVSEHEIKSARATGIYGLTPERDLWANAEARALETIAWELYEAATLGIGIARTTTSTIGFMNGLRQYIDVSGGNVISSSGALTTTQLDNCTRLIFDDMSDLSQLVLVMPTGQNQALKALDPNSITYNDPQPTRMVGFNVGTYIPNIANSRGIPIIVEQNMPIDEVWLIDRSRVRLAAFFESVMRTVRANSPGTTAMRGYVEGEYTLVVRNGAQAFGVIKGLAT